MDITLTKDSEKLLCIIYKDYLEKRKSGIAKSVANNYNSSEDIHKLLPDWNIADVNSTCYELKRSGMINHKNYDNVPSSISISDIGIMYMENRFKDGLLGVIDFLSKFIP